MALHRVFAQDGTLAGILPDGLPWSTKWIDHDEFVLIEHDDLDVPYLVRFRVER